MTLPLEDRIARVEAIPCRVPFRRSFVIGRGAVGRAGSEGQHLFVRVENRSGAVGWGEARALPAWSYETIESLTGAVRNHLGPLLLGRNPFELGALRREFDSVLAPAVSNGMPFAKCAVETALLDLQGRLAGLPLHALLGGKLRDRVELTYALGIAAPEAMAAEAEAAPECRCFKVKIAGDPEEDVRRVRAVARARPDATLWLDANQAYAPACLPVFLTGVRTLRRVFCLEQPVRSQDWYGLRTARRRCPFPVAVDEGCFSHHDAARIAGFGAADLLVLKACKSGGPASCLRSAAVAEAVGMGLLGSGLTESGVGFTASVHLFSTMDLLLPPELNGVQFLESMWVEGLDLAEASVAVPDGPGLGVTVDEAAIRDHAMPV